LINHFGKVKIFVLISSTLKSTSYVAIVTPTSSARVAFVYSTTVFISTAYFGLIILQKCGRIFRK